MPPENPTGDAGASITERLESYLAAKEQPASEQQRPQTERPKEEQQQAQPEQEVEAPNEAEVEATESDAQEQASEPQITLTDLAKYLGVEESMLDVDDDGGLQLKTKIDGKEGAAKLQDLLKSYQLQGHVDAKAREAAEHQKALQERVQQFEQYAQAETNRLTELAGLAYQELLQDAAGINWNELAVNDPAEYVRQQHLFQQRQARVNQLRAEVEQRNQQADSRRQAEQQKFIQAEYQRLPVVIPEWSDATVAEKEMSELRGYAKKSGFSDADLDRLNRADMVSVLRKAWLYDQGKAKAATVEKQVRAAPKLVKPGQSVDARQRSADNVRDLKTTIRKSGGKSGIAEYLLATGKV